VAGSSGADIDRGKGKAQNRTASERMTSVIDTHGFVSAVLKQNSCDNCGVRIGILI
jgi:hypothetical protein